LFCLCLCGFASGKSYDSIATPGRIIGFATASRLQRF